MENFVQFPDRCEHYLGTAPKVIPLGINYRSRKRIVSFCSDFITHPACDWRRAKGRNKYYRVLKDLEASRKDAGLAVVASDPDSPDNVSNEIATLVKDIITQNKVDDPNQIAFLYPSLKSEQVSRMREALEARGLRVYAPRAGTFLEVPEAVEMLGLFLHVFGMSKGEQGFGADHEKYQAWMKDAYSEARILMSSDSALKRYIDSRKAEIAETTRDYRLLLGVIERQGWNMDAPYEPNVMRKPLTDLAHLSKKARSTLRSGYVDRLIRNRAAMGRPFSLKYIVTRAT